jgi:hypothetical protein
LIDQLHDDGPGTEELDDEELAAANHWLLPSTDFDGMWDSLVFDDDIKGNVCRTCLMKVIPEMCCAH